MNFSRQELLGSIQNLLDLLDFSHFKFNENCYLQRIWLPMGSDFSPCFAKIASEELELVRLNLMSKFLTLA